jgi:hypothetical protein
MIELYLRQFWAKVVVLLAITATVWYIFQLYQLVYAPLFINEPMATITDRQYATPQGQIDTALQALDDKAKQQVDFSTTTSQVTTSSDATNNAADAASTEGITISETAP